MCTCPVPSEFYRDNRFRALGTAGIEPSHFHDPIRFKSEKSAVVWVTFSLMAGLEEERRVDFGVHQQYARRAEPMIQLHSPSFEKHLRRCGHGAFDCQSERSR